MHVSSCTFVLFLRRRPLEIIQKFRLGNLPISSADFPMIPMEGQSTILALFRRRILRPYPAAPFFSRPLWFTAEKMRPEIGHIYKGVTERGVFTFACQSIVSPRGRTGNRTVTQMRHPLLIEGRPNCARQSFASTLSAPRVAGDIVL